jgi:hypothetical protein
MRTFTTKMILTTALGALLAFGGSVMAQPAKAPTSAKKTSTSASTAPTAQEIADAKAKGLVWVNTSTKVYHKDGQFYGTTKQGKFMTEADAEKAGYRAAKQPGASKKTTSDSKKK